MTAAEAVWTIVLFLGASIMTALTVLAWGEIEPLFDRDRTAP